MHVSKDVSYIENNIVLSAIYQVPDVNFGGIFGRSPMASIKSLASICSTILRILF